MDCLFCGTTMSRNARFCGACGGTLALPLAGAGNAWATPDVEYAGFWIRFGALLIDGFATTAAFYAIVLVAALLGDTAMRIPAGLLVVPAFAGLLVYPAVMHSSPWQATLGKKALGLKVTDLDGQRLTLGRAILRYAATILSGLILYIGYIMAAFDDRKRALHDRLVGTYVVKAN